MRIVVPVKQLPDVVEELEVDAGGADIDREFLKFVPNEWDEQALEEALLIKEAVGAEVVVVGLDEPDIDQTLYTALARGADRAVKLTTTAAGWVSTSARAEILTAWLAGEAFDLILTGVQAADDLDGQLAAVLAARLGLLHAAVVVAVEPKDGVVSVTQELGRGTNVEEEMHLPAVIGVQAARQAPRYASITRVRQAMQAGGIEELPAASATREWPPGLTLRRLYAPEATDHAEMLDGGPGQVADRIIELLRARGLVGG
ncbi:MAG: electron transfer flavoprotein subunit beta/FixA family protein [Acidimicrobiales bacterium]